MFALTALVYPVVLAALCCGAGLLVDRLSGGFLPGLMLPAVGGAALIGVSQLSTYPSWLAPGTPYLLAGLALAGFALGRGRARSLGLRCRHAPWQAALPVIAYCMALAPVLLAGRPTLSSYMALTDSAVHLIGADYLISHGQSYAHLDLGSSFGQYINVYYHSGYPSGADTLLGASTRLVGLPLIWTYQPFNAFMLALASGPAWQLVRRVGLDGAWALLAALTVTLPALVYAYELIGSIKEITALPMILTLGALVVLHHRWIPRGPRGVIPFALAAAAGIAAIGVAFVAWGLVGAAALALVGLPGLLSNERRAVRATWLAISGALVVLLFSLPTWIDLSGSVHVASSIASTSNPGNLHTPLSAVQVFGTWLGGSYKLAPPGAGLGITHAVIALTLIATLIGVWHIVRNREYPLAAWIGLSVAVWLALTLYGTTWTDAKTLMLSSPVLVLLAWAGVAGLRTTPARLAAPLVAGVLVAGVLVSDAMLYHASNLAPTARYEEMSYIDSRFAGKGPALFTDYDEYAMYELRDLDIGGPNFIYQPPALQGLASEHGYPVDLNRALPATLRRYPLIITRRDPESTRPPAAYALIWEGAYYQVWARRRGAEVAIAHVVLSGGLQARCSRIGQLARRAQSHHAGLVGASATEIVPISLAMSTHPSAWKGFHQGLVMAGAGELDATFSVPVAGRWELWVRGDIMRAVHLGLDGHRVGSVGAQISGSSLTAEPAPPIGVWLAAGRHRLSLTRGGADLAPGDGGSSVLDQIFLTPAGPTAGQRLVRASASGWRSLCHQALEWLELAR